jgi:hypothetical protein
MTAPSLPTQQRLNDHLIRWNQEIIAFDRHLSEYGSHKADLEHKRAVMRTTARVTDPKITGTKLDDVVEADEDVYRLHVNYRASEANLEATRARLRWFQAVADALRSQVATERAERALYADHGPDA